MKKIIILDHNGGRLCNQLWNYVSIYAYCLENNYDCQNYSFYRYDEYFQIGNKDLFYKFLLLVNKATRLIKKNRITHYLYKRYSRRIETNHKNLIIDSGEDFLKNGILYLPPTPSTRDIEVLRKISDKNKVYFKGWLARNPIGLEKYRDEITRYFRPESQIAAKSEEFVNSLRARYNHIVGVHIRQGDYKRGYLDNRLYFSEEQVAVFMREYLKNTGKELASTCFILCSDDKLNLEPFKEFNFKLGLGGVMEDLYTLSLSDSVLGSDSTFGAYASYYGNIPFVVFDQKGIDWSYYQDKTKYFENINCTQVCY